MAEADGQEKTEQATGKKLEESRKEGKVAKSTEISSFAVFTSGLFILFIAKGFISDQISELAYYIFNSLDVLTLNKTVVQLYALKFALFFFLTLSPVFIGIVVIAFIANVSQVGLKFSMKAMKVDINKFNPVAGFKKIFFSSRSIVELSKSILKLSVIGFFTYLVLKNFILGSITLADNSIDSIVTYMLDAAEGLLWKIVLVYAVFAGADFLYQKFKFKKDMMMTKQEVKEEHKQAEGDPIVKGKIRSMMLASSRRRMMKDVPTADVVITNPTHFAVALKYDPVKGRSPIVVAKGVDELAQKIKKVAVENNVPLHEDRELARSLYKFCDIGEEIPEKLYHAVAKVLAYIFSLRNKKKRKNIV